MKYSWWPPDKKLMRGKKVMCPKCMAHKALLHPTYGVLPCTECKKKSREEGLGKLGGYPEFTTESIKTGRKEFVTDQFQSHRGGHLSREFVEAYPERTRNMIKDGALSRQEVKKSKYVWKDLSNWNYRKKKVDANMV